MSDKKIKHIHSLCSFPAKRERVKLRDFKFTKFLFFKLQFISSSGHNHEIFVTTFPHRVQRL